MTDLEMEELREQIKREVLAELDTPKKSSAEFADMLKHFDGDIIRILGTDRVSECHRMRDALRTIIRMTYRVRHVSRIPPERLANVEFVLQQIILILHSAREMLDEESGGGDGGGERA